MRRTITLALAAFAAVIASAQNDQQPQQEQQAVTVVIDGQPVQFTGAQPTEINGRVMVPLRGVFRRMGATVDWDPGSQTITAFRGERKVRLTLGDGDASVNGESVHMDVPAQLLEDSTMVPLRFISEALGAYVGWNQDNHEVDITSNVHYHLPGPPAQSPPPPVVIIRPQTPPTPPPSPPTVVVRPLRTVPMTREIRQDTVLPAVLDTRLSSYQSRPGDVFTATLETDGNRDYMGIPRGTQIFGRVEYVRPTHHRSPGVIELRFTHLVLPDGRHVPIDGTLVSMSPSAVLRTEDGHWMANDLNRGDRFVFVGYDNGKLVPISAGRPLAESNVDTLIWQSVGEHTYRLAHDVVAPIGARIGIRLDERTEISMRDR